MQDDLTPEKIAAHLDVSHNHEAGLIPVATQIMLRDLSAKLAEVTRDRDEALTKSALSEVELERIREAIKMKGGTEHSPTEDAYTAACGAIRKHKARAEAAERALATAEADDLRKAAKVAQNNQAGATAVFRGIAIAREILALIPQEPT